MRFSGYVDQKVATPRMHWHSLSLRCFACVFSLHRLDSYSSPGPCWVQFHEERSSCRDMEIELCRVQSAMLHGCIEGTHRVFLSRDPGRALRCDHPLEATAASVGLHPNQCLQACHIAKRISKCQNHLRSCKQKHAECSSQPTPGLQPGAAHFLNFSWQDALAPDFLSSERQRHGQKPST